MMKIICVCGARPNFMKIAPLMKEFKTCKEIDAILVHTGQHYDNKMSHLFFDQLNIPTPDINLEVGSGSHAIQTAEVMRRFEPVILEYKPDYVLVVGDVNSTIACGLVAVKLGVKLIHVEAGLRSFDRSMPEEINRILTDSISDLMFVTEQSGVDNLKREGVNPEKVHLVGNLMIDTLIANRDKAAESQILTTLELVRKKYVTVTLHRPSNVDNYDNLEKIFSALDVIQKDIKVVFPIHPRTKINLEKYGLQKKIIAMKNMILLEPVGYLEFLKLTDNTAFMITDSGGIQEETTILGIPCMTLRENTERPITIYEGTNQLVKLTIENILEAYKELKDRNFEVTGRMPLFWDGHAAERIVEVILNTHRITSY